MSESFIDKMFDAFWSFMEFNQEVYFHPYRALNKYLSGGYSKNYKKQTVYSNLSRFRKKGFIVSKNIDGERWYKFTKLGISELERRRILKNCLLKQKQKWNGKWCILVFDIPEINKKLRDYLRIWLKQMKCKKLQNSVWISPYNISEEIRTVLKMLNLEKYTIFIIAETIENEGKLKKEFNLK